MAAWHETKPGPDPGLWVGVTFGLVVTAALAAGGFVLYHVLAAIVAPLFT